MFAFSLHLPWAILLTGQAIAIPWEGPKPTLVQHTLDNVGWSAKPTNNPQLEAYDAKHALFGRQLHGSVCGYYGGNKALAVACATGNTCVFNPTLNLIECCLAGATGGDARCGRRTRCVDMEEACDRACQSNGSVLHCITSPYVYCGTYLFPNNFSNYFCYTTPATLEVEVPNSTEPPPYGPARSKRSGSATIDSSSQTFTSSSPTTTSQLSQGNTSGSSTTTNRTSQGNPSGNKTNVLVGGVVGGVVGFTILGILGYTIWFRKCCITGPDLHSP